MHRDLRRPHTRSQIILLPRVEVLQRFSTIMQFSENGLKKNNNKEKKRKIGQGRMNLSKDRLKQIQVRIDLFLHFNFSQNRLLSVSNSQLSVINFCRNLSLCDQCQQKWGAPTFAVSSLTMAIFSQNRIALSARSSHPIARYHHHDNVSRPLHREY